MLRNRHLLIWLLNRQKIHVVGQKDWNAPVSIRLTGIRNIQPSRRIVYQKTPYLIMETLGKRVHGAKLELINLDFLRLCLQCTYKYNNEVVYRVITGQLAYIYMQKIGERKLEIFYNGEYYRIKYKANWKYEIRARSGRNRVSIEKRYNNLVLTKSEVSINSARLEIGPASLVWSQIFQLLKDLNLL